MGYGNHARKNEPLVLPKVLVFLISAILFIGAQYVVRENVFEAYGIPSGSMETTIMTEDRIVADKLSYRFGAIRANDIVTFQDPMNSSRILLKRCIAVEGQTVDIHDGAVYINGMALSEPYTNGKPSVPSESTTQDIVYPYTVPEGHIWVMGDNRTNSMDSRFFGSVPVANVYGRALLVYWPPDHVQMLG